MKDNCCKVACFAIDRFEPVFDRKNRLVGELRFPEGAAVCGGPLCVVDWCVERPGARRVIEDACRMRGGLP